MIWKCRITSNIIRTSLWTFPETNLCIQIIQVLGHHKNRQPHDWNLPWPSQKQMHTKISHIWTEKLLKSANCHNLNSHYFVFLLKLVWIMYLNYMNFLSTQISPSYCFTSPDTILATHHLQAPIIPDMIKSLIPDWKFKTTDYVQCTQCLPW